jgi:hypothetical protein
MGGSAGEGGVPVAGGAAGIPGAGGVTAGAGGVTGAAGNAAGTAGTGGVSGGTGGATGGTGGDVGGAGGDTGGTGGATGGTGGSGGSGCNGAGEVLNATNSHCYLSVTAVSGWTAAQTSCQLWGGELAALSSALENAWVMATFAPAVPTWIGGNDLTTEGTFVWNNGEPWGYTNWDDREPAADDCMEITSAGLWRTYSCTNNRPHICEK